METASMGKHRRLVVKGGPTPPFTIELDGEDIARQVQKVSIVADRSVEVTIELVPLPIDVDVIFEERISPGGRDHEGWRSS